MSADLREPVDDQITALFDRKRLPRIRGSQSPLVFIWDIDVVAIIEQAVTEPVLRAALAVGSRLGLKTVFGRTPTRTSRQAFDEWRQARRSY